MTHAIEQTGVALDDRDARARAAVKAFRALQPTLSAYARVLTKNPKVRVEMSSTSNGKTDGTKIFFRPPIELGDPTTHVRKLCDKRNDGHQLLCPACLQRESVLTVIYHEIAHICYDSFQPIEDHDRADALKRAIEACGTKYAKKIEEAIRDKRMVTYHQMSSLISKYLPLMVNALEDARIESKLFGARKGTRVMFDAMIWRVFTEGFESVGADGKPSHTIWRDAPLDTQATIALYVKAGGYAYTDEWFQPVVLDALADDTIVDLCIRIRTARSAADVYHIAFPMLARMRELGFFRDDYVPEDEEPEPEPQPEGESDEDSDDPSDDDDDESEGEPGESGTGGDGGDSEAAEDDADDSEGSDSSADASGDGAERDGADDESVDDGGDDAAGSPDEGGGPAGGSDEDPGDDDDADPQDEGSGQPDSGDGAGGEVGDEADGSDEGADADPASGGTPGGDAEADAEPDEGGDDDGEGSDGDADGDESGDPAQAGTGDDADDTSTGAPGDSTDGRDPSEQSDAGDGQSPEADPAGTDADGGADQASDDHAEDGATDALGDGNGGDGEVDSVDTEPADDGPQDDDTDRGGADGDDPIDTGADDGTGGVTDKTEHDDDAQASEKDLPHGDPDQAEAALVKWLDHEEKPDSIEMKADESAVDKAIIQGLYFEAPSQNIHGVREHYYGKPNIVDGINFSQAWMRENYWGHDSSATGQSGDFAPPERIMGPALLKTRRAFTDNARGGVERNLKSGHVSSKVLGRRAPLNDPRLFSKRRMPGKRSYHVVIMMDISGSTVGKNILIMKEAVMAQAELLSRAGIPFSIYAQSGQVHSMDVRDYDLEIYVIKEHGQPWDTNTTRALTEIGPDSANLDGHALEYARKRVEEVNATDKIILFYSDGKMPAANHDEELEILQREIRYCRHRGITLLGVGIRTDSPARHGLETVQLNNVDDTHKVVEQLGKYLIRKTV